MKAFAERLSAARGSAIKARRTFIAERRWKPEDWFRAWPAGLGEEIEAAVRARGAGIAAVPG